MKWTFDKLDMPGPIQFKKTEKALRAIMSESSKHDEIDKSGMRYTISSLHLDGTTERPECAEAYQRIGNTFSWIISRENHKSIIAVAEKRLAELVAARPLKERA